MTRVISSGGYLRRPMMPRRIGSTPQGSRRDTGLRTLQLWLFGFND